jgi:uncharacterized protein (TIGR03032 family)
VSQDPNSNDAAADLLEMPPGGDEARVQDDAGPPFSYVFSPGFAELLDEIGSALLVSTYQAGKLMVVRSREGRLTTLLRGFEKPMGVAISPRHLAVGTRRQIWFLRNAPDIAPQIPPVNEYEACFVPSRSHVTGDFRAHELAWVGGDLWVVNTRFSCLCTLSEDYSFVPRWRPPFISELTAEDRCHLNGLAVADGRMRYVTAHGSSNERHGWRPEKASGGVLMDVDGGQVVSTDLSMPHSPRLYGGRLWVLNSGYGELQVVDEKSGRRDTVARLPGFTRGLAFHGRHAFVGLSKVREKKEFGGLPLEEVARGANLWRLRGGPHHRKDRRVHGVRARLRGDLRRADPCRCAQPHDRRFSERDARRCLHRAAGRACCDGERGGRRTLRERSRPSVLGPCASCRVVAMRTVGPSAT